jgi:hypothetical protein
MPVIPATRRQRQEDYELKANLGYIVNLITTVRTKVKSGK